MEMTKGKVLSEKKIELVKKTMEAFKKGYLCAKEEEAHAVEKLKGRILNRYFKANGQVVLQHEIIEDINKEFGNLK